MEVINRDGLVGGDSVVLGLLLDDLVHRLHLVGDLGHDALLLDDGLDGLVEVVVDRLASDGGFLGLCLMGLFVVSALEASSVGGDLGLHLVTLVILVDLALFSGNGLGVVLGGFNLLVCKRLDGGVVVVLVTLAVDDSLLFRLVLVLDVLVLYGGGDLLCDSGVLLACGSRVNDWSLSCGSLSCRSLDCWSYLLLSLGCGRLT